MSHHPAARISPHPLDLFNRSLKEAGRVEASLSFATWQSF